MVETGFAIFFKQIHKTFQVSIHDYVKHSIRHSFPRTFSYTSLWNNQIAYTNSFNGRLRASLKNVFMFVLILIIYYYFLKIVCYTLCYFVLIHFLVYVNRKMTNDNNHIINDQRSNWLVKALTFIQRKRILPYNLPRSDLWSTPPSSQQQELIIS